MNLNARALDKIFGVSPFSVVVDIPAPVDYVHLKMFGVCNPECPFHRNDEQSGYACTLKKAAISMHSHPSEHDGDTGWEEPVMRPGPGGPRHQKNLEAKP